jgi:hypothetical protein
MNPAGFLMGAGLLLALLASVLEGCAPADEPSAVIHRIRVDLPDL